MESAERYFAEIVLEKKKENPALELIAVIPYRKRLDRLNEKGRTYKMLEACRWSWSGKNTIQAFTPGAAGIWRNAPTG